MKPNSIMLIKDTKPMQQVLKNTSLGKRLSMGEIGVNPILGTVKHVYDKPISELSILGARNSGEIRVPSKGGSDVYSPFGNYIYSRNVAKSTDGTIITSNGITITKNKAGGKTYTTRTGEGSFSTIPKSK